MTAQAVHQHQTARTVGAVALFLGAAFTLLLLAMMILGTVMSGHIEMGLSDTIAWALGIFGTAFFLYAGIKLIRR